MGGVSLSTSRFSNKGYVFTFESAIALLLVLGFVGMALIYSVERQGFVSLMESGELIADLRRTLDENGFIVNVLDNNDLSASQKMDKIYAAIKEAIPKNFDLRVQLTRFDSNKEECLSQTTFDECFERVEIFPERGSTIPSDREVLGEKFFLVEKQAPGECEVLEEAELKGSGKRKEMEAIAFFEGEMIFLQGEDLNIEFSTNITPEGEVECDEEIRVDLNASIPSVGRQPADIMLVIDKSGSMNEKNVNMGKIGGGSFNDGTYDWDWLGCSNYGNWQTISSEPFNIEMPFAVRMYYSGYDGSCTYPRLRLVSPSLEYDPSQEGSGDDSPIIVDVGNPELGEWEAEGWSDDLINYDLNYYYQKMGVVKVAAKTFVDYEEWTEELDQLGMFSFNQDVTEDQTLVPATSENKEIIKEKIDELEPGGSTAIGDAIWAARNELLSERGNPDAMKFEVLLSDGKTNSGSDPIERAQQCADDNIIIYTVGLGEDADEEELQQIASITGGEYYYATDLDVLLEVYNQIALEIGAKLEEEQDKAYDANVRIELPSGAQIVDLSNGEFIEGTDSNYIAFQIGYLDYENPWSDYFVVTYACNLDSACNQSQLTFPGNDSYFHYENAEGEIQTPIQWNDQKTIQFKYRDLKIEILSGQIVAPNELFLDVNASNVGLLSTSATNIRFYLDDEETGELLDSVNVSALQPGEFTIYYDQELNREGLIVAIINQDAEVLECPRDNIARIRCYSGAEVQYYLLDVWVWRK